MSRPPSIASQSVVALAGDDLPPFLSFSVVRARLLSPISSKSAAGDNVTAEREGLLRIHGGQHGLSAVPCDTEWWRRERERERGLTRSLAHSGRRLMPIIRRKSHHHHQTIGSCSRSHPRSCQCNGGARPPISLPPGAKRTQEGSRALARRTGSRKKEGGGVCPRHQETEREGAAKSAVHHHHHPPPPTITCERHLFVLAPPALVAAVFP